MVKNRESARTPTLLRTTPRVNVRWRIEDGPSTQRHRHDSDSLCAENGNLAWAPSRWSLAWQRHRRLGLWGATGTEMQNSLFLLTEERTFCCAHTRWHKLRRGGKDWYGEGNLQSASGSGLGGRSGHVMTMQRALKITPDATAPSGNRKSVLASKMNNLRRQLKRYMSLSTCTGTMYISPQRFWPQESPPKVRRPLSSHCFRRIGRRRHVTGRSPENGNRAIQPTDGGLDWVTDTARIAPRR